MKTELSRLDFQSLLKVFFCLILSAPAALAQIELVKDINLNKEKFVNEFEQMVDVNGIIFFVADGDLWSTDGTASGSVEIKKFVSIERMIAFNNALFFVADDGVSGKELWKSNGTSAGTVIVKDIVPGILTSNPKELTIANGVLFFAAADRRNGREIWRTDGSSNGTHMVKDIRRGGGSSNPTSLVTFKQRLFFVVWDDGKGYEIWYTTGTNGGTKILKDIVPGVEGSAPKFLTVSGSNLFFSAKTPAFGRELWKSDGTATGTTLVKDIIPGPSGRGANRLLDVNGTLFFTTDDKIHGTEFWKSDGTASGTVLAFEIAPGKTSGLDALFSGMATANGKLYFVARGGVYESDGTQQGTKVLFSPSTVMQTTDLHTYNNVIYFFYSSFPYNADNTWLSELIKIENSNVLRIKPGLISKDTNPPMFITSAGTFFSFAIDDGDFVLWKSDGTSAGTNPFLDVSSSSQRSYPAYLTAFGNKLVFVAYESEFDGHGVWISNGTPEGSEMLKQGDAYFPAASGSHVFFLDEINSLWKTDGTPEGTQVLKFDPYANFSNARPTDVNGTLYFSSESQLWKTDGTDAGTVRVKESMPGGAGGEPNDFVNLNGLLMFSASVDENNRGLWKSNGTEAGTLQVGAAAPGMQFQYLDLLFAWDDHVYFFAFTPLTGYELWRSDGTNAGTTLVKDIVPNENVVFFTQDVVAGVDALYIVTSNDSGVHLWKSDGTPSGTETIFNFPPYTRCELLQDYKGNFYFSLRRQALNGLLSSNVELWRTDGTTAGTRRMRDFFIEGPGSSLATESAIMNNVLYIQGSSRNLWRTDGTDCGTFIVPFASGSDLIYDAEELTEVQGTLYFSAHSPLWGQEVFKLVGDQALQSPCDPVSATSVNDEAVLVELDNALETGIAGYPNPFEKQFHFRVNDGEDKPISASVVTLEGRTLVNMDGLMTNRDYVIGNQLTNGIYLLKVKIGSRVGIKRIVKIN